MLDYADPLTPVMTEDAASKPVGALMLATPVTGQIAQLMGRDTHAVDSMRPRLVQKTSAGLEEVQVRGSVPTPVPADRLHVTGADIGFARRASIDGGEPVYSYGRLVPELNWYVLLEVPANVVDARLRNQAWMIFGIGGLISVGIVLLCALLWWIMIGRQQRAVAEGFERLYRVIQQQKQLLDSVNVSLDVGLLMATRSGQVQVCNRAFASIVHRDEKSIPGSSLLNLFDSKAATRLLDGIRSVVERNTSETLELSLPGASEAEGEHLFRVTLFPFEDRVDREDLAGGVAIFQDITEFRRNSERRRQQQVKTISALVRAIESVDPYLTGHSQRMTELADLVSHAMNMSDRDRETIRMAASLSQMGKLFIPRDLLAKSGQLSSEEQAEIMRAPTHAFNMLRDIDFGLPVAQAVYEMSERMDGKGYPQQLAGDAIAIHARVLAAVNALCAMISPRSYRSGMPVNDALGRLRGDTSFDPQVIDALARVLATPEGLRAATPMQEDKS